MAIRDKFHFTPLQHQSGSGSTLNKGIVLASAGTAAEPSTFAMQDAANPLNSPTPFEDVPECVTASDDV